MGVRALYVHTHIHIFIVYTHIYDITAAKLSLSGMVFLYTYLSDVIYLYMYTTYVYVYMYTTYICVHDIYVIHTRVYHTSAGRRS